MIGYCAFLILTITSVFPLGAQTSPGAGNGKIVFSSSRDGNREIYTIEPNGVGLMRLTSNNEFDGYPSFSPNGRKIAYLNVVYRGSLFVFTIKTMNADGSDQQFVTEVDFGGSHRQDFGMDWSPDGEKLAFPSNGDIWTINIDGTCLTNLTNSVHEDGEPSFSPDGSTIAFSTDRFNNGMPDIHLMNSDGSALRPFTTYGGANLIYVNPKWSPNGNQIAFLGNDPYLFADEGRLIVRDATGGPYLDLLPYTSTGIAWSPDGTRILVSYGNEENIWGLYTVDRSGGTPSLLYVGSLNSPDPDWAPATTGGVSGRIKDPQEQGLRNARVTLTSQQGITWSTTTSSFGYFSFEDLQTFENYTITVRSKRYRFAPHNIMLLSDLSDIELTGSE